MDTKGEWCRYDLVPGLHTHGEESQMQRSRSRAHCDAVAASYVRSEGIFEALYCRAENELVACDDIGQRLLQVGP